MSIRPVLVVAGLLLATAAAAEPLVYQLTDPAQKYRVELRFAQPPADSYESAPATVSLRDKTSGELLQTLDSPAAYATLRQDGSLSTGQAPMYGDQSALFFDDFNFDGEQDLALRNGSEGGYGGPSYDVYLFDPSTRRLQLSPAFSDLTRNGQLGMFDTDRQAQRLHTWSKSGCCWHQDASWKVENNLPLMVEERIEQGYTPAPEEGFMPRGYFNVTYRALVDGQWQEHSRLESPVSEAPQVFRGTLEGKIPVELWWQRQGEVLVGEVRYPRGGSGQPILLVGGDYETGSVTLVESGSHGEITGTWYVQTENNPQGKREAVWVQGAKRFNGMLQEIPGKVAEDKLGPVADEQRSGRYLMRDAAEQRSAELILTLVPGTDPHALGSVDVSMRLERPGVAPLLMQQRVPLTASNLAIVWNPQTRRGYRLQLLKGALLMSGNYEYRDLRGTYIKQP